MMSMKNNKCSEPFLTLWCPSFFYVVKILHGEIRDRLQEIYDIMPADIWSIIGGYSYIETAINGDFLVRNDFDSSLHMCNEVTKCDFCRLYSVARDNSDIRRHTNQKTLKYIKHKKDTNYCRHDHEINEGDINPYFMGHCIETAGFAENSKKCKLFVDEASHLSHPHCELLEDIYIFEEQQIVTIEKENDVTYIRFGKKEQNYRIIFPTYYLDTIGQKITAMDVQFAKEEGREKNDNLYQKLFVIRHSIYLFVHGTIYCSYTLMTEFRDYKYGVCVACYDDEKYREILRKNVVCSSVHVGKQCFYHCTCPCKHCRYRQKIPSCTDCHKGSLCKTYDCNCKCGNCKAFTKVEL